MSKGTFGDPRLQVARKYLYPGRRRALLLLGGVAAVAILAVALWSFLVRDGKLLAAGPLSSNHATLDRDCAACHQSFAEVTSESCSPCHEKYGDEIGVFSFASHYLYRSNDFSRVAPSEHETACAACHLEHLGREAEITQVPVGRCLVCHDYGAFDDGHPQFDFAAENIPDDDALTFPHTQHVREVMSRQALVDVERACLYCHNPQSDGRNFEPIEFDRHCDACHLTASDGTTRLPIRRPGGETPGVLTLADLQGSGGPNARWAFYTDPNEYRQAGNRVMKSPLHHLDRWVLENLRELRRVLYPDAGLADLLRASAEVPASETRGHYREALATLEEHATGLRGRPEPEIQAELKVIDALLRELAQALDDPYTPLDETEFLLALERPSDALSAEQVAEIELLVDDLTAACRRCHVIDRATIARVQDDQRILRRAEFDHCAHILQVRCLECHAGIPIMENLPGTDKVDQAIDNAAIQNLPRLETCQECHNPRKSSSRCVTCHLFHPDQSRRSHLLLYLDPDEPTRDGKDDASQAVLQGG